MPLAIERVEVRVPDPDQPLPAGQPIALGKQLLAKPTDDTRLIGEAIATAAHACVVAILIPQPLGGTEQERVDVARHLDVRRRADDRSRAVLREPRQVHRRRSPDEEILGKDANDVALDARAALLGIAGCLTS
jgi:hypothetical protein